MFEWLFTPLYGIEIFWLKSYLIIAFMFMSYFFIRLISYAVTELGLMLRKFIWGAFVLPVFLGLLWPFSVLSRIVMKRWVAAWMNNMHWWEN